MIVDFHTHTTASDGILSPTELVSRANSHGVNFLAVTDHDTVDGLSAAKVQASQLGMRFLNGIEFSAQWHGIAVHIVGLGVDADSEALASAILTQKLARSKRAELIAERLARVKIDDALDGATALAGGATLTRPHFARFLVEQGYCQTESEAFRRYLGAGKIGDVKNEWPDFSQVVEWIRLANGVAVIAHPEKYKMTRTKLCRFVEEFKSAGGEAIEVISGLQSPNITEKIAQISRRYQLLASCGSDFHMPNQKWQELGSFGKLPSFCEPVWQVWS